MNREVITVIGSWPIQRSGQVILEGSRTEDTRPDKTIKLMFLICVVSYVLNIWLTLDEVNGQPQVDMADYWLCGCPNCHLFYF